MEFPFKILSKRFTIANLKQILITSCWISNLVLLIKFHREVIQHLLNSINHVKFNFSRLRKIIDDTQKVMHWALTHFTLE